MVNIEAKADRATELLELADRTLHAAMAVGPEQQQIVLKASETIEKIGRSMLRKIPEVAVLELPENATVKELRSARTRQAVRRGQELYLPIWSSAGHALPDVFRRTALFSASSGIQKQNDLVLAGDGAMLMSNAEIASFNDISLLLSGYRLCQYDRQVYATCLEFYRERPLAPVGSHQPIRTTFHALATLMGGTHNAKTYQAIRASLLRLSFATLRLRSKGIDTVVPSLLSVTFEDDGSSGEMHRRGLLLSITEPVADLFGRASWSTVDKAVSDYDGLRGWLANFYASFNMARWLSLETLYKLSGYDSRPVNFRNSLITALDKLQSDRTPESSRVRKYKISADRKQVLVALECWRSVRDE